MVSECPLYMPEALWAVNVNSLNTGVVQKWRLPRRDKAWKKGQEARQSWACSERPASALQELSKHLKK